MTFGDEYLTHLRVIQSIGMAGIEPITYKEQEIVPLQFLTAVLPDPEELGESYDGEISIGCRIRGIKDGEEKTYCIWSNCIHQTAYEETGTQGVSYTTGVPAMTGAYMMLTNQWTGNGVFNVEEFNPDPFLEKLSLSGLIWYEKHSLDLEVDE